MSQNILAKKPGSIQDLETQLLEKRAVVRLGGGAKRIEAHKKKGKLTARERIEKLIDPGSTFMELGMFTGDGMYEEEGGCPSGGTVAGIGYVSDRMCVIVANDATVKAGAWFPITAKKNLRAQEVSIENRLPIIYLVDSAGIYLPLQADVFADKEHFGRIFRNNSIMSSMGIVQIAAIMGSCVAGGAYLPIMSDEAMIVEGTGSVFLAGSYLVKSAVGEDVDNETLGGATTHCEISGVTDYKHPNDEACLKSIRNIIDKMGVYWKKTAEKKEQVEIDVCIISYAKDDNLRKFAGYKSEWVCERIISVSSNENDNILIPFVGTGTECFVAKKLNRRFIGSEILKDYCKTSQKRLKEVGDLI
jgi:acetyl-CoA carboxylase carboxyltransferase component